MEKSEVGRQADHQIEIALAEYGELRAEITRRSQLSARCW